MLAQHRRQFLSNALAAAALLPFAARRGAAATATADPRQDWLTRQFRQNDSGRSTPPAGAPDALSLTIATWDWLRRPPKAGAEPSLSVQAAFLVGHGDWPAATTIRRRAEAQAADLLKTSDNDALAFFRALPPQSAAGEARLALLSSGDEARRLAKRAWSRPYLPLDLESALQSRFSSQFTAAEHAARADALLWAGQTTAAKRLLPLLAPDMRALMTARLALRSNGKGVDALVRAVPARLQTSAGLLYDRAIWRERNGQLAGAEAIFAAGDHAPGVGNPVPWLEKRLQLGRAAMRRGDNDLAWRILASHNSYAPQTDLAALPLNERILLSDTEWLAGWLALRKLNQPDRAVRHFTAFNASVTTPISKTRGDYWLGRAEQQRGKAAAASAAFERAARHADYFYGQLAAEALGRAPAMPMVPRIELSAADWAKVEKVPQVQALLLLNRIGDDGRTSLFVRSVAGWPETPAEARTTAELGQRLNRPDLGVWAWKSARADNDLSLFDLAYPRLPEQAPIPPRDRILSHAIARQESSFDSIVVSPAGARGLMQLMPATAQDVAKKAGLPYNVARLTSDPSYNVQLGAWYIGRRRDEFQNRMLAIAAYNAGAGNVRKWLAMLGDPRAGVDAIDWVEMIPFTETRNYVQRVIENAVIYSLIEPKRPDAEPRPSVWLQAS